MDYWWTTRPHEDECWKQREAAKKAGTKQECLPGCRHGQAWPTLRLNRYAPSMSRT